MQFTKFFYPILFLLILIFGIFVYFFKLNEIPNGFYIDEALPGYNAYSILKTARDDYGKFMPLVFRFVGSYNPPLYTYLTALSIDKFGLNIFSVRFFASLAGLLSIFPFVGILISSKIINRKISILLGAFLFMISPWLILHSRIGYEVSLGFFLFVSGIYFAWIGLKSQKYFIPGIVFLSLSTYAAFPERFAVPIFLILFSFIFRKQIFSTKNKKYLYIALAVGLVSQIPNLWLLTTPAFFPKSNLFYSNIILSLAAKSNHFLPNLISIPIAFVREFSSLYFTYFSPKSLFFGGDPDLQRSIPELSTFYFWEIIPYVIGIYFAIKMRKKEFVKFLALLLLITPIPAALTGDPFSTHRAIMLLFPIGILITIGIDQIMSKANKFVIIPIFIFAFILSLVLFWRSYLVLMPHERAINWGYGVEQLAQIIKNNPEKHFVIDTSRTKPTYINLAFFMKIDPAEFQKSVNQNIKENYYTNVKFDGFYKFANLETKNIDWNTDIYEDVVLVGDDLSISAGQAEEHGLTKMFEIVDPVGEIIFKGYAKK